jgi:hypothetical protein
MVPTIEPNAVYDDTALVIGLGLTTEALSRARRAEGLRYVRKGRRFLYRGAWIIEWLERCSTPEHEHEGVPA